MSGTRAESQPGPTVDERVERIAEWLTANRPGLMVGLLLDNPRSHGIDEYAELLLVNPAHEHLLKPNWRMGVFYVARTPPFLASANLRWGINTVWVPDADHCEETLQNWDW